MLKDYLTGKRKKEPRLIELAQLAHKTMENNDVLVSIRKAKPKGCIKCGRQYDAKPVAVPVKGHTEVVLVCDRCEIKDDLKAMADVVMGLADADKVDTVFIWEDGNGKRYLMTNDLTTEELPNEMP